MSRCCLLWAGPGLGLVRAPEPAPKGFHVVRWSLLTESLQFTAAPARLLLAAANQTVLGACLGKLPDTFLLFLQRFLPAQAAHSPKNDT